jgi:endonuclease G, mitochondrial
VEETGVDYEQLPLEMVESRASADDRGARAALAASADRAGAHGVGEQAPELRAALVELEAARERRYYDAESDGAARGRYYEGIDQPGGAALYRELSELLGRTHEPRPAYKPARLVYPWVDLHPDRLLRSVYSGKSFTPEELIRADVAVDAARTERLQEFVRREFAVGPAELEAEFEALEAQLPFNCEHVVPQSWFGEREPMRGDLHHLFACEPRCNSFRGNLPYADFPEARDAVMSDCGRSTAAGFEPGGGKGPVARATLYFLLRYPGQVGDDARELQRERVALLLDWHRAEPVGEYERHRNAAIAELQGNRNPLIDHPDWSERIRFEASFER